LKLSGRTRAWLSVALLLVGLWAVIRWCSSWATIVAAILAFPTSLMIGAAVMRRREDIFAAWMVALLLASLPIGLVLLTRFVCEWLRAFD
jgi:hypothetical protein